MTGRLLTFQLRNGTRLRPTRNGGAALIPATAITVELDGEAFAALSMLTSAQTARDLRRQLLSRFPRNFTLAEVEILLRKLAEVGLVEMVQPVEGISFPVRHAGERVMENRCFPPESVHLQLNNVCNLRCPSCYVSLQSEDVGTLLERLRELIDEWADMGVFQLALGGGEPLMSPKLAAVARHARARGLVPNVTTNGWLLTPELLAELDGSLGEIRLSLNDVASANLPLLEERTVLLRERDVRFGFNLIVTRPNLGRLAETLRWACSLGAATITLIRPKPAPGNEVWYARNVLSPAENLSLQQQLRELEPLFGETTLAVDCAFSFLFHGRPAAELHALGVAGCAIGERFAVVAWNGDVYPCSHLRGEEFRAGNVATESFGALWERSLAFERLRRELPQGEGHCGTCGHAGFCKGCRAVAQERSGHWQAADPECGHALPPGLVQLSTGGQQKTGVRSARA